MTNKTIRDILNHRSIRNWKNIELDQEIVDTLLDVAMQTATSTGMQAASIIKLDDPEKRQALADVAHQQYIKDAPLLLIFIADNYRNSKIVEEAQDNENYQNDADRFFAAYTDAAIMAQNVVNAAESLGLGTVFLGSILNDARKTIEILELPKLTMPVVGLAIGYPNQEPQLKPRMNKKFRVFHDRYEEVENYHDSLEEYDSEMKTYYDLRDDSKPLDKFTKQVVSRAAGQIDTRAELAEIAREQGYEL